MTKFTGSMAVYIAVAFGAALLFLQLLEQLTKGRKQVQIGTVEKNRRLQYNERQ